MISVKFHHGLGDAANFAHTIPLWISRGHQIEVQCTADKASLFEAAGAKIVQHAKTAHHWPHPPASGRHTLLDHHSGNKTAHNLEHGGMPAIGTAADLWQELLEVKLTLSPPPELVDDVKRYMDGLARPVICLHTRGNTGPDKKNYLHEIDLYRELLDRLGGTCLVLDWDSRVPWFFHYGVRHMKVDWKPLNVHELYQTIQEADLFVGIDSGPLHFTRFTSTPAIGVWTHHHPAHYALPRSNTVHLVVKQPLNRYRRLAYNLVETTEVPVPAEIAVQAARMLAPRQYLASAGADLLLQHLVDKCRATEPPHHQYRDRHRTFAAFFNRINDVQNPLVVETGCIRAEEDFSAGFSTYIFGHFLKHHGGELISVDIDKKNVAFARTWTTGLPVTVHQSDSRPWLKAFEGRIDGLYLDSADTGTPRYQQICLDELKAAMPHLSPQAPILIDDTPYEGKKFGGKGGLAVPYLLEQGWQVELAGYQVLLRSP